MARVGVMCLLKAYPIISRRPFGGRGVGGEGGSYRSRFSQSIPTIACPHPNPLPKGEGDFLDGPQVRKVDVSKDNDDGRRLSQRLPAVYQRAIDTPLGVSSTGGVALYVLVRATVHNFPCLGTPDSSPDSAWSSTSPRRHGRQPLQRGRKRIIGSKGPTPHDGDSSRVVRSESADSLRAQRPRRFILHDWCEMRR